MKDYPHILTKIKSAVWLMERDSLAAFLQIVDQRLSGEFLSEEEIRARISRANNGPRSLDRPEAAGGVGVIPIHGPIFPKANLMTELSGASSIETLRNGFREMMANDKIGTIIFDIDSPGGMSDLVPEFGEEIRAAREEKKIISVANTMAGSAAYWLGSQASEFYVTPSGSVGSIGAYTVHTDHSGENAQRGRAVTYLSAGRFKVEGNPDQPLSDETKSYVQQRLDEIHDEFVQVVAAGRDVNVETVRETFGQGRMLTAPHAAEAGMVDGVASFDDILGNTLVQSMQNRELSPVFARALKASAGASLSTSRLEHVPEEHSEPGTGPPPEPREDEPGEDRGQGSRWDTPPPGVIETREVNLNPTLLQRLGLSEGATSEQIEEAVTRLVDEIEPLREAEEQASRTKTFREQYPEEYEEIQKSRTEREENAARKFAQNFERFEGSTIGLSALQMDKVEDVHLKMARKQLTESDLTEMLNSFKTGVVDYGERGSSRERGDDGSTSVTSTENPRQEFAAQVREIMEQDGLDRKAAIKEAAKRDPDLFAAYRAPVVNTRPRQ